MMIPKLTDDAISMLPLESGRAELLEEIMTTVAPDRQTEATPNPTPRRNRWLAPVAAAAVVAGLAGGTVWWQQHRPEQDDSSRVAALGLPEGQAVVLDAPGWKVDSLGGDGIQFRKGDANLEVTSYAAKDYDSYVEDREHIVDPPAPGAPVTVLGRPGAAVGLLARRPHRRSARSRTAAGWSSAGRGWTRTPTSRCSASSG